MYFSIKFYKDYKVYIFNPSALIPIALFTSYVLGSFHAAESYMWVKMKKDMRNHRNSDALLEIAHQPFTSHHYAQRRRCYRIVYTFERVKNANTLNVITFIKLHCTLFRDVLAVSRTESFGVLYDQNGGVVGSAPARIHP